MNRRRKTPLVSAELTAATDAAGSWTRLLFQRADPKLALRAAQAMAQTIDRTLGVAGALAQTGRTVDLTGLEELIGRLTAASIDLDDDDRQQIQPTLNGLLHSVARLENALHPPRGTG